MSPECTSGWAWRSKVFFEWEKLNPSNENYGSTTTVIANLIFLADTPTPELQLIPTHCWFLLLLVCLSYRKRITHTMYCKGRGVCWWSTKKHVCILLDFQEDHLHTSVITQVVSLNSCDLFIVILVAHKK